MYYSRFSGQHYAMGFKYGDRLYRYGVKIDFQSKINLERLNYGEAVYPVYKKYYPEIIAEIQGLTDGQRAKFNEIFTFLTSIYVLKSKQILRSEGNPKRKQYKTDARLKFSY